MLKTWLLGNKPHAIFDAANSGHRRAYYDFLKLKSWRKCSWQFVLEEPHTDLPANIRDKLVEYYTKQEFAPKKTKTKVVLKSGSKK
jgi:hypothetical protein